MESEFHTCPFLNEGFSEKGMLNCWTCWMKIDITIKNIQRLKQPILRPRIISTCKHCKQKSRVERKSLLCVLCDTLSCIY